LLFVPLYLHLCGWEAALGRQGWHTFLFERLDEPWLSHWRGAVFVHAVYAIPWATVLMVAAFSHGPREQEEMALLDGTSWQVFSCVTLRQLAGGLLIAAVWVFVTTAGEMTVTNIYLVHTYAEDVYNFYSLTSDVESAVIHNGPMILFSAALAFAVLGTALGTRTMFLIARAHQWSLGRGRQAATTIVLSVLGALVLVPLANMVERMGEQVVLVENLPTRSWSAVKLAKVLLSVPRRFGDELLLTFAIAVVVAGAATALAIAAAWLSRRRNVLSTICWLLAALAASLPGPVIGLSVIWLLNRDHPLMIWLYDRTIVPPVVAIVVRVLPLAFVALWWAMRSLDSEPLDAAQLEGANSLQRLVRIALPQRWPIVAVAAVAAFAIASGDVSCSILTIPPLQSEPIARRMFGLIHIGTYDEVAAIGFACWVGYILLAAGAAKLLSPGASTAPAANSDR
jgi:iron(III) transport system permease protein